MSPKATKVAFFFILFFAIVEAGVIANFHLKLKMQGFLLKSLTDSVQSSSGVELIKLIKIECSRPYTGNDPDFLKILIQSQRELAEKHIQDPSLSKESREMLNHALSYSCPCCQGT